MANEQTPQPVVDTLTIAVASIEHEVASLLDLDKLFTSLKEHEAALVMRKHAAELKVYAARRVQRARAPGPILVK